MSKVVAHTNMRVHPQHFLTEFEDGLHYLKGPKGEDVEPIETHPDEEACESSGLTTAQIWGFSFAGTFVGAFMSIVGAVVLIPSLLSERKLEIKHTNVVRAFAVSPRPSRLTQSVPFHRRIFSCCLFVVAQEIQRAAQPRTVSLSS